MTKYVEPQRDVDLQGHDAGMVSRFIAFLLDSLILSTVFALLAALALAAVEIVIGETVSLDSFRWLTMLAFATWWFLYFALPWAASGRSPGQGILGLRVTRVDGSDIGPRRAAVRAATLPLSFLLFGVGFLMGLVQRRRRCLHDFLAGTVVVYSWDARAARMRLVRTQSAP